MNAPKPPTPPRYSRYLIIVGLCLYGGSVWYFGWRDVANALLRANPVLVAACAAIIFAGSWLRAWKWRYALGPGANAYGIYFLSKISAEFTPGRLGEFSPMMLRRHRTPKVGAWIMYDRILEVIVTLALGLAGLATIRLVPAPLYGAILGVAVAGSVLVCYLLTRRSWFLGMAERTRADSWPYRFAMLFAAMSEELALFARRTPVALAFTIAAKCGDLYAIVLLFRAFGYAVGFGLVAAAKCALAVVSFIPLTPAATGLPHLTQAAIMNQAAQIPGESLSAAIGVEWVIVNGVLFVSGLIAGAIQRHKL